MSFIAAQCGGEEVEVEEEMEEQESFVSEEEHGTGSWHLQL